MVELMHTRPGTIGFRVEGVAEPKDITQVTGALDVALKRNEHVHLVADLSDFEGMTVAALMRDIAEGVQRLGQLPKLGRVAVITDQEWVATAAEVEDALLPGVTVRRFGSADASDARQWVAEA
jgi:hypothetical protein